MCFAYYRLQGSRHFLRKQRLLCNALLVIVVLTSCAAPPSAQSAAGQTLPAGDHTFLPFVGNTTPPAGYLQITDGGDDEDQPALAPDNQAVVYVRRMTNGAVDLFWQPLFGAPVNLTRSPGIVEETPVFTGDGAAVVFAANGGSDWDLYQLDLETQSISPLITAAGSDELHPTFGNGGQVLYFSSNRAAGNWDIYAHEVEDDFGERLTTAPGLDRFPTPGLFDDSVVYRHEEGAMSDLYVYRNTTATVERLTDSVEFDGYPAAANGHTGIVYRSTQDGEPLLRTLNLGGGSAGVFAAGWAPVASTPRYSPDGKWLAFSVLSEDGDYDVWIRRMASPSERVAETGFQRLGDDCGWSAGILAYGWGRLWRETGTPGYFDWLRSWVDGCKNRVPVITHVNDLMLAYAAILINEVQPERDYQALIDDAAHFVMHRAPRTADGSLIHLDGMVWDDTLIMTLPFLVELADTTGDGQYLNEAAKQFLLHAKHLQSAGTGLMHHAWDEATDQLYGPAYWARGNGWVLLAGADLLAALPPTDLQRPAVLMSFQRAAYALVIHQDTGGLWPTVVDHPDFYREVSGSALIAASLAEGVAHGWLDPTRVAGPAMRARYAVWAQVKADGVVGGVSGPTGPMQPVDWYNQIPVGDYQSYGQGVLLRMAAAESAAGK